MITPDEAKAMADRAKREIDASLDKKIRKRLTKIENQIKWAALAGRHSTRVKAGGWDEGEAIVRVLCEHGYEANVEAAPLDTLVWQFAVTIQWGKE